ncbi:MAG: alpha/beta hydrolase [Steroidobacteraceae bacterium]|nr:alpha/beta hydrolase [Steroidobacteraceae bacterium]
MLVILHGWSDTHASFRRLGNRLVADGIAAGVKHVRLGDYVSMDDDVTFDDLAHAMQRAWQAENLPTAPRSVDVVVHSTGGLVARHWMTSCYRPATNPIRRLLMLAPANFGSPLAHKGRSFMGRVVKGFKSDKLFQTGTHILKGLEVASPFSWELALRDRFSSDDWYGPGRVLCTVLVGTDGYSGIAAAANESGTDGTVRVATANLNAALVTFNFATDPQSPPAPSIREANGATAFARIPRDNHSTIALKDGGPRNPAVLGFVKRALTVDDSGFAALCADLEAFSDQARKDGAGKRFTQGYQDTVIRLTDSMDDFVTDYFLEVFAKTPDGSKVDDRLTRAIQEEVMAKVHVYGDNAAYRSLMFNTTAVQEKLIAPQRPLYISVTAMPDIRKTRTVGYSTFGYDDIGSIKLMPARIARLFRPDRTVLVDMTIRREQTDRVFRILPLS